MQVGVRLNFVVIEDVTEIYNLECIGSITFLFVATFFCGVLFVSPCTRPAVKQRSDDCGSVVLLYWASKLIEPSTSRHAHGNKMSVTFPSPSQDSVTSKYVVPLVSLVSDEEDNGDDKRPAPSKTITDLGFSASISLKRTAARKKSFDHVANTYYEEQMKHLTTKKRGCVAETGVIKKRAGEDSCVPVVVIDTSGESSG
ncbi:uncharacterized protein [Primulina huaijiensis]|uniref:uncharacterized protein n=1 Tax=Primulina huaijiensis TaxID=1492673 RepID=UPI003CC796D8